ncbi:Protein kinase domain-containing protein [Geodermatophilus dictyosporus]|uniref:non-specific serine/threonine protein kinase n=1 Tax=Geodermatophilus dictyosporus TaxID=1523247 RepID=A0A1I5UN65_9ACTN|nr:protein kinase [Geodermatophilus dictyosporus]SFP96685.1 Protein kinase domain-containing protein [Geodermatophilus dictyosporus]
MVLAAGARVGGYEIVRRLGAGAMGAVYVARHPNLPKDVALKVLAPGLIASAESRARFAREAEVLCRLDHPNIAGVRDRGEEGDVVYLVMDLVPGPDLESVLMEQGTFAPERAVAVVEGVAAALDHAHDQGLVHRDIKPANVLLRDVGTLGERAVVTDFGIVRDLDAARLTEVGVPLTHAYAAPEQFAGTTPDRRTDVYALGALLFELLTGRRAFDADLPAALIAAALYGPVPDPRALRPDLPAPLAEVCTRAMAKVPSDRYPTAGALAAAARSALDRPGPAPETVRGTPLVPPPPGAIPPRGDVPKPGALPPPGTVPPAGPGGPVPSPAPGADVPGREVLPRPRRRRQAVTAAVCGAVLALAGGVVWVVWPDPAAPGTDGTVAAPTSTDVPGPTEDAGGGDVPGTGTQAPVAPGTCLDAAGTPSSCAIPHAAEVVATDGPCDVATLLGHLGGVAGEDVLRASVVPASRTVDGATVCVVDVPADAPPGPARDVLLGADDDAWRRCADEVGREVSCERPHRTEVVAEAVGGTPLDCRQRADSYLGRPFDQVDAELRLLPEAAACVVEVRGDNVLVASLRRLGTGALPVEGGAGRD